MVMRSWVSQLFVIHVSCLVCVNVRRGYDGRSLKLDMINLNSSSSWFHSDELEEQDGSQTVVPRHELMNIVSVTQLEKDTILVCYDSEYKCNVLQMLTLHIFRHGKGG